MPRRRCVGSTEIQVRPPTGMVVRPGRVRSSEYAPPVATSSPPSSAVRPRSNSNAALFLARRSSVIASPKTSAATRQKASHSSGSTLRMVMSLSMRLVLPPPGACVTQVSVARSAVYRRSQRRQSSSRATACGRLIPPMGLRPPRTFGDRWGPRPPRSSGTRTPRPSAGAGGGSSRSAAPDAHRRRAVRRARWRVRRWVPRNAPVLTIAGDDEALDVSMVGVALPSIRTDLHMSTSSLQWIVSAYVLGYGGFLLLGGRAADLLGRRRMFLISLAVFAVASALGGLANDGLLLIATRCVKGVSAAFTAPAGLSIITTSFAEGPARNKAISIYTATGATGFSLGLVFSGLLTEVGWRWVFFLPVVVAAITLAGAIPLVPGGDRPARSERAFDLLGAVSLTGAMLLLVYTLVEAPDAGWASAR